MKSRIEYVVHVGGMEWGTRSVLEEGVKLYEDAKKQLRLLHSAVQGNAWNLKPWICWR